MDKRYWFVYNLCRKVGEAIGSLPAAVAIATAAAWSGVVRKLYVWIGLGGSAVALWLAFRQVDWDELGRALRGANYLWLIPSAVVLLAAIGARAERWRWLLGGRTRVSWRSAFRALSVGYMITNVFPFRLGEVARLVV